MLGVECTTQAQWNGKERLDGLSASDSNLVKTKTSSHDWSEKTSGLRIFAWTAALRRFASPYLRLARLHTVMAWAIFPAPALYTAILFHATQLPDMAPQAKLMSCLQLCTALFLSVMSYRAAGLAWDDLIDRDCDAKVTRSKSRPLPAGDLTVDGAMVWIIILSCFTVILIQSLLAPEVSHCFFFSAAIFLVYPFLKRGTHYTQLVGALLISMGVIQAWVACAAVHAPVTGAGSGWTHVMAIVYRDAGSVVPIFFMEYFYELAHELIYGCQDTGEDIEIGLFSLSILCGYDLSWRLGLVLVGMFACLVAYCAIVASLPAWPLTFAPVIWLLFDFIGLDLSIPSSCGTWASRAIKVKVFVTVAFGSLFLMKELGLPFWPLWPMCGMAI